MQVQSEIRRGTFAVFITKYSNIFIGLLINSFLARLLSPAEYGTLGIVTVFISFFNILGDIGIGPAIIQNQDLVRKDLSDIFKLSILLSVFLAIMFGALAYGIAWYYENPVYRSIGQLLGIAVFFSSMSVVPKSMLAKRQAFRLLGTVEVCVAAGTGVVAVILANHGWSYYSIIWRSILASACIFGLHFYFSGLKIESGFSLQSFRKMARYSFFQFGFNFVNYFSRNLDNILIGKFMGNRSLGIYNQSYQLMMYPVANLTHVITPVLHPVLAKFKNEPKVIFQEYLKVIKTLAMLGVPLSVFIFFSTEEIIYVVLGDKWKEVVPVLKIFSISIWIQMITSSGGAIFQALGRTDTLFKLGILSTITIISSILTGVVYLRSLEYTAMALDIAFAINFIVAYHTLTERLLKVPFGILLKSIVPQVGIALCLIFALLIFDFLYHPSDSTFSQIYSLLAKAGITGIIFCLFHVDLLKLGYQKVRKLNLINL